MAKSFKQSINLGYFCVSQEIKQWTQPGRKQGGNNWNINNLTENFWNINNIKEYFWNINKIKESFWNIKKYKRKFLDVKSKKSAKINIKNPPKIIIMLCSWRWNSWSRSWRWRWRRRGPRGSRTTPRTAGPQRPGTARTRRR